MYEVEDPCIQHAIKKLLCAGKRGHKDYKKDITEAFYSLIRFNELNQEEKDYGNQTEQSGQWIHPSDQQEGSSDRTSRYTTDYPYFA